MDSYKVLIYKIGEYSDPFNRDTHSQLLIIGADDIILMSFNR
ncbi:MAG: hypothetical protein U9R23_01965 [Candidatus Cloacimonadota bacterium]|nr:hypothetical protein [Candidatus Cloacimonadota bacterium]